MKIKKTYIDSIQRKKLTNPTITRPVTNTYTNTHKIKVDTHTTLHISLCVCMCVLLHYYPI